ncbi:putative sulfite [Phaeomoniella chlamydospora]|uniref:Putative sulfite n=1 Tax=Phaeomoniella chlamydospora TaxID=158046 RepID=A0A0G2HKL7_PHACM|nr:putative sulfite [Phaeomoniella chlamydospora]
MSYFQTEPPVPSHLSFTVKEPLNREPGIGRLVSNFITSNEDGFDRNHGPIPHLSKDNHLLVIDGIVATPMALSITELEESFPEYELTCALQCAGNRRNHMGRMKPVRGVPWNDGAVMNCTWSGVLLRDVLLRAGVTSPFSATSSAISNATDSMDLGQDGRPKDVRDRELHVWFYCSSAATQDERQGFGGSIPLSRALDPAYEVMLAMKMNGETLPVSHGYPIRAIVPGQLGARSVKWLDRITISVEESFSYYQRRDYKILPESVETIDEANGTHTGGDGLGVWPHIESGGDMPVNSAIGIPASHTAVTLDQDGCIEVKGYALPGGENGPVIKVEVSTDDGDTWTEAQLSENRGGKWCWSLWSARVKIERGEGKSIWSRATDGCGHVQPRFPKWNLRGVMYNGYGEARGLIVL